MTNDIEEARAKRDGVAGLELVVDFRIDDDPAIDARSFVLGVEFWRTFVMIRDGWIGSCPIHRTNYERLMMATAPFVRSFSAVDLDDAWVELRVT